MILVINFNMINTYQPQIKLSVYQPSDYDNNYFNFFNLIFNNIKTCLAEVKF